MSLESEKRFVGNLRTYESAGLRVANVENIARIEEVSAHTSLSCGEEFLFLNYKKKEKREPPF